jgi:hypothetical protein
VASNRQRRKAETFTRTLTYWTVLTALVLVTLGSMIVVAAAGMSVLGVAAMVTAFVFAAVTISYGASMRYKKQAPSR